MFKQKMFKAGIAAGSFIFMAAAPGNKPVIPFDDITNSCLINEPDCFLHLKPNNASMILNEALPSP